MRKTRKRIRRQLRPLAQAIASLGNDADRLSRRAHQLAELVNKKEQDNAELEVYYTTFTQKRKQKGKLTS